MGQCGSVWVIAGQCGLLWRLGCLGRVNPRGHGVSREWSLGDHACSRARVLACSRARVLACVYTCVHACVHGKRCVSSHRCFTPLLAPRRLSHLLSHLLNYPLRLARAVTVIPPRRHRCAVALCRAAIVAYHTGAVTVYRSIYFCSLRLGVAATLIILSARFTTCPMQHGQRIGLAPARPSFLCAPALFIEVLSGRSAREACPLIGIDMRNRKHTA